MAGSGPLVLTEALADRIERALAGASASRTTEIGRLPDDPLGLERRTFGRLMARLVRRELAYYPYFSGPFDPRADADHVIDELVAWYRERSAACYIRLSPVFSSDRLLAALARAGLRQSGFMSVLFGKPRPASTPPPTDTRIDVVKVSDLDVFLDLWTAGAPEAERPLRQRLARAEFARWCCFVARVDDRPAAHAALYLDHPSSTAVLAAAATLPDFRGRGCQAALLHARLAEAARHGCELAVVEATPGSTSQRNLERVDLRLAYTKVIWTF